MRVIWAVVCQTQRGRGRVDEMGDTADLAVGWTVATVVGVGKLDRLDAATRVGAALLGSARRGAAVC